MNRPLPPTAKPKPDPTLSEILSGVDIIGTMLHLDLPKLEQQIQEIRTLVTPTPSRAGEHAGLGASNEITVVLEDLREMLQLQNERLLSLERRLSHLTALCEQWTTAKQSPSG